MTIAVIRLMSDDYSCYDWWVMTIAVIRLMSDDYSCYKTDEWWL